MKDFLVRPRLHRRFNNIINSLLISFFFLLGFVGIAPVATNFLSKAEYEKLPFPCLFISGERDSHAVEESKRIGKIIPNCGVVELVNAGHAAYMNQREAFHHLLAAFMKLVDGSSAAPTDR